MGLHAIAKVEDLPPGARKLVKIGAVEIGVFNVGGRFLAYRNVCPHAGAPVCVGRISGTSLASSVYEYQYGQEGRILRCPWHGWEFDLLTGHHLVDSGAKLKPLELTVKVDSSEVGTVDSVGSTIYVSVPGFGEAAAASTSSIPGVP
jgi:nitrite reductase (NADH) small subunit